MIDSQCGKCEWVSLLPIGLDDKSLLNLKSNPLPPKISTEIQQLMDEWDELNKVKQSFKRNEILKKLIDKALLYIPTSRAEYQWYLKFVATVLLLKDLPLELCTVQGHLLTNLFSISTTIWDGSPIKIHYFASDLYDIFENDLNMMYIINQIESKSRLGFYLSTVMLWKSIYRCVDEEKDIFRLYPPSNLIEITAKMDSIELEPNFEKFQRFVSLFSKLANLLFHHKQRSAEYICFKEFFAFDLELIKTLRKFLERVVHKAEVLWRKNNENLNILTIIEFLQIDISELDTLVQKKK